MKEISDRIQVIIFFSIITGFMVAMFLVPERTFSEQENRVLKTVPSYSFESVKSGAWMKEFEEYLTDQFPLRDHWIAVKSYAEKISQKTENNGVFFCSDDTLIKRFDEPDRVLLEANVNAVNAFVDGTDLPVYVSLIPGAVSIWDDKLPENARNCNQKELIDHIYSELSCPTVDNYSVLKAHKDEYIYYRTDHHWTSLGAYYGYVALADAFRFKAVPLEAYEPECVSDDFYGTVYSASGVRWVKPDRMERYVADDGKVVSTFAGDIPSEGIFYDYEKLRVKDKYAFFFGGNAPLLRITSDHGQDGQTLLVIRDSYSDSEIPFLTEHFSNIYMMDLRYYKFGVKYFLQKYNVDAVLINYSAANFCEDRNIVMIGK